MIFPSWVGTPADQTKEELATKRLRFMISQAAVQTVAAGNISAFADFCGVERSSIHTFISSGAFSARTATKIERAVGRDVLRHEDLMYPLEITESAA